MPGCWRQVKAPTVEERKNKSVISFGEVLWDRLPGGAVLGGAPLNLALRLAGLGLAVCMVSRVGADNEGRRALEQIRSMGLDCSLIQRDSTQATGAVEVSLSPEGIPEYTILPERAYDRILFSPGLERTVATARCVCFGTLVQRTEASRETLYNLLDMATGALKFLDLNLRQGCYSQQTVTESLRRADILKLNAQEVSEVMSLLGWSGLDLPAFCTRSLVELGLAACVISLGAGGALAAAKGTPGVLYSPGYRVEVLDTVGSGDAFSAGFLDAWLRGRALTECCRRGNLLGALNCARRGATEPVTEQEIQALDDTGAERWIVLEEYR